jgi:hypothetical protein
MDSYSLTLTEETTDVRLVQSRMFSFKLADIKNVINYGGDSIRFKLGNFKCQVHSPNDGVNQIQIYQASYSDDPVYWSNEPDSKFRPVIDSLLAHCDNTNKRVLIKTYLTTAEVSQITAEQDPQ